MAYGAGLASDMFVSASGSFDLHLKLGAAAVDVGKDLSATFTNDIDDQQRPAIWDIGADELINEVFYSVGIEIGDLSNGSPSITISSGVATLSVAQTGHLGVGDVIDYDSDNKKAYILAVLSPTQFRVQSARAVTPGNVTGVSVSSIKRAFNSITDAENLSSDASHLGTANLVTGGYRLTWVCYDDGPFLEEPRINGYTTDASHFTTLTVAGAAQVASGVSQRHDGTAGTGAVVRPQAGSGIGPQDPYIVVEWLEVDGSDQVTNTAYGIDDDGLADNGSYRNLLVHDFDQDPTAACLYFESSGNVIRNTIAYGCGRGLRFKFGDNNELYNSTFHDAVQVGVYATDSSVGNVVQNVIATGSIDEDFLEQSGADFSVFKNNISQDNTAGLYGGTGNQTGEAPADLFANVAGRDLHLKAGSAAIDNGLIPPPGSRTTSTTTPAPASGTWAPTSSWSRSTTR